MYTQCFLLKSNKEFDFILNSLKIENREETVKEKYEMES